MSHSASKLPLTRREFRVEQKRKYLYNVQDNPKHRATDYQVRNLKQNGQIYEACGTSPQPSGQLDLPLGTDNNCNTGNSVYHDHEHCPEDQTDLGIVRAKPPQDPGDMDFIPETTTFTILDLGIYVFSIISYLADVGSDIWVAYMYYRSGDVAWFSLTVVLILVPSVTMSSFSLAWYVQDHKSTKNGEKSLGGGVGRAWWMSRSIFLFLQITPVIRYIECLVYGLRSKKKRTWYMMLVLEDTDAALLRLVECFMEAAPQLVLQLYILTVNTDLSSEWLVVGQVASCITSLASVSWALTSYHRALRLSLQHKANITFGGMILQFLWFFFMVGSRVVALAMFASVHKYWVFVVAACHWLVMFAWILVQHTQFCYTRCQEVFFNMVTAIIYIFCYFNLLEGHTRLRYVFYGMLMYAENAGIMLGWYAAAGTSGKWYITPALAAVLGGFFIGLAFQLLYYTCCHPNNVTEGFVHRKIQPCVPWKHLYLCHTPPDDDRVSTESKPEKLSGHNQVQTQVKLKPAPHGKHSDKRETNVCIRKEPTRNPGNNKSSKASQSNPKCDLESRPLPELEIQITAENTGMISQSKPRLSPSQWKELKVQEKAGSESKTNRDSSPVDV